MFVNRRDTGLILIVLLTWLPLMGRSDDAIERSDEAIAKAIAEQLQFDEMLRGRTIDVEVNDGVAKLDGPVATLYEQERVAQVASTLKGVRAVVNTTTINSERRPDDELITDVKVALAQDPATESFEIDVKSSAANVTLSGTVDSYAEKLLAGQVAKDVRGVHRLSNDLKVRPSPRRSDEEIDAEITRRLEADVWVDQRLIRVFVEDGHAILRGVAGTLAERQAAEVDAWAAGVKSVDVSELKVDWQSLDSARRKSKFAVRANYELKDSVADALQNDPRVNRFAIDIDVRGGVVVLSGQVHNLAAKRAAEQDAFNTVGVTKVANQLKVARQQDRGDEELVNDLRAALARDAYLSDVEVDVSVDDGRAVLSGEVRNAFVKRRADQIASRVVGLVDVENQLEVAEREEIVSDLQIKYGIKNRMYWSGYMASEEISVAVDKGVVTLSGEVDNRAAFEAAARMAMDAGATEVHNRLMIRDVFASP